MGSQDLVRHTPGHGACGDIRGLCGSWRVFGGSAHYQVNEIHKRKAYEKSQERGRAVIGKRETADGGCPGVVEPMKDVARLREAMGRGLAPGDPSMSEWGNPPRKPAGSLRGRQGGERKHLSTSSTEIK